MKMIEAYLKAAQTCERLANENDKSPELKNLLKSRALTFKKLASERASRLSLPPTAIKKVGSG